MSKKELYTNTIGSVILIILLAWGVAWAADTKLSALTNLGTAPEGTDELYIVDNPGGTPVSRSLTVANLFAYGTAANLTITGNWVNTDNPWADNEMADAHSHAADSIDAITEIAAALKSGADGTLVTGTKTTADNLLKWNADGDAVDSDVQEGQVAELNVAENISGAWSFNDDVNLSFGTGDEWSFNYDDSVDDQLLLSTGKTSTQATTDPMFEILVDTGIEGMTANQQVFGVAVGSQASNTPLMTLDEDGDVYFEGDLTLGGSFSASNTKFNDLQNADGAGATTIGAYQHVWTTSLDTSGGESLTIKHSAAAITNDTYLLQLEHTANADAQGHFLKATDASGTLFRIDYDGTAYAKAFSALRTASHQYSDWYEGNGEAGDNYHRFVAQAFASTRTTTLPDYNGAIPLSTAVDSSGYLIATQSGTNPTTDAAGEYGIDTDDSGVEFYDGTASRFLGALQSETFSIVEPDTIQGITDDVVLKHFMADAYPHGVTIKDIAISAASAYTSEVFLIEEWDDRAGTTQSTVESITISSQYQEDDGTLSDASIAADAFLVVNLDGTPENIPMVEITVTYWVNPGD